MPAVDTYPNAVPYTGPADNGAAVTPSDSTDLAFITRALYVGGAGNVALVMKGGQTVTFTGVTAGQTLPIRVARVLATGTTATALVALW